MRRVLLFVSTACADNRWLLRIALWTAALLLGVLTAGCAPTYQPEPLHPTWEQLVQLSESFTNNEQPKPLNAALTVYPAAIIAGASTWITCYVPEHLGPGRIRVGLEGHVMSGPMPIERIEYRRLIERVSCGTWTVSCELWLIEGAHTRLTKSLQALGACNQG